MMTTTDCPCCPPANREEPCRACCETGVLVCSRECAECQGAAFVVEIATGRGAGGDLWVDYIERRCPNGRAATAEEAAIYLDRVMGFPGVDTFEAA